MGIVTVGGFVGGLAGRFAIAINGGIPWSTQLLVETPTISNFD